MKVFQYFFAVFLFCFSLNLETFAQEDVVNNGASVSRLEAKDGVSPGKTIAIIGEQLEGLDVWCEDVKLQILDSSDTKISVELPFIAQKCRPELKKGEEIVLVLDYSMVLSPQVSVDELSYFMEDGKEYVRVVGSGFYPYYDAQHVMRLVFDNGTSLSRYTFVSDTELIFQKTSVLPFSGTATLNIEGEIMAVLQYVFFKNFPRVQEVSYAGAQDEYDYTYNITIEDEVAYKNATYALLDGLYDPKIIINNTTVDIVEAFPFVIGSSKPLSPEGTIRFEYLGFSHSWFYRTNVAKLPELYAVRVKDDIQTGEGRMQVYGDYFTSEASMSITSSLPEVEIATVDSGVILLKMPIITDAYEFFTLTVRSAYGASRAVKIPLDMEEGDRYQFPAEIDTLSFPLGAVRGGILEIKGAHLQQTTHILLGKKSYAPDTVSFDKVSMKIPDDFPMQGVLGVVDDQLQRSAQKSYTLQEGTSAAARSVLWSFQRSEKQVNITKNTETIYTGSVINTDKPVEATVALQLECNRDCKAFPVKSVFVIDAASQKQITKAQYDSFSRSISFSVSLPVSIEPFVFHVRAEPYASDQVAEWKIAGVSIAYSDSVFEESYIAYTTNLSFLGTKEPLCVEFRDSRSYTCSFVSENNVQDSVNADDSNMQTEGSIEEISSKEEMSKESSKFPFATHYRKSKEFPDSKNHWAKSFIDDMYMRGVIQGTQDGYAKPDQGITRAEMIAMVLRMRDEVWLSYGVRHFEDTSNHWAGDMLEYALEKGYIKQVKYLRPDTPITRAEAVGFIVKVLDIPEKKVPYFFEDIEESSSKDAIVTLYAMGIIHGKTETLFAPQAGITRAEIAKILSNIIQWYEQNT